MIQQIKSILKKIVPPPVKTFMREINILKDLITQQTHVLQNTQGTLLHSLSETKAEIQTLRQQTEELQKAFQQQNKLLQEQYKLIQEIHSQLPRFSEQISRQTSFATENLQHSKEQNTRLDRLHALFESINRENLRQYFETHSERIDIKERYLMLTQKLKDIEHLSSNTSRTNNS